MPAFSIATRSIDIVCQTNSLACFDLRRMVATISPANFQRSVGSHTHDGTKCERLTSPPQVIRYLLTRVKPASIFLQRKEGRASFYTSRDTRNTRQKL